MLTAYERHLIVLYLANAAARLHHRGREAASLAEWVTDHDNRSAPLQRLLRRASCQESRTV